VQDYLSLLKDVTDYKLSSGKLLEGADVMGLRAVGWMGANEVILSMDALLEVAEEVVKEYNDNQTLLESQAD
jgi:hypothetical protein